MKITNSLIKKFCKKTEEYISNLIINFKVDVYCDQLYCRYCPEHGDEVCTYPFKFTINLTDPNSHKVKTFHYSGFTYDDSLKCIPNMLFVKLVQTLKFKSYPMNLFDEGDTSNGN